MPTYEYLCDSCGHRLEALQKITENPLKTCPKCHKDSLKRRPGGGIGLSFTGSGFYITDYGRSGDSKKEEPKDKEPPSPSCSKGSCGCH